MAGSLFRWKVILLILILVSAVLVFRIFCRFLCPLGAIYGLFNKFSLFGMQIDKEKCNHCGECLRCCKMDVRKVGDAECIHCGECIENCPQCALRLTNRTTFPVSASRNNK